MVNPSGLMMTIGSDDEIEEETDSSGDEGTHVSDNLGKKTAQTNGGEKRQRKKVGSAVSSTVEGRGEVDPSFSFDVGSSLGIAESQAIKGWDFKSETILTVQYNKRVDLRKRMGHGARRFSTAELRLNSLKDVD